MTSTYSNPPYLGNLLSYHHLEKIDALQSHHLTNDLKRYKGQNLKLFLPKIQTLRARGVFLLPFYSTINFLIFSFLKNDPFSIFASITHIEFHRNTKTQKLKVSRQLHIRFDFVIIQFSTNTHQQYILQKYYFFQLEIRVCIFL